MSAPTVEGGNETARVHYTFLGGAAVWPFAAHAQQKPVKIGFLGASAADTSAPLIEAVKQGLRDNGLIEGRDYAFELRWADVRSWGESRHEDWSAAATD